MPEAGLFPTAAWQGCAGVLLELLGGGPAAFVIWGDSSCVGRTPGLWLFPDRVFISISSSAGGD